MLPITLMLITFLQFKWSVNQDNVLNGTQPSLILLLAHVLFSRWQNVFPEKGQLQASFITKKTLVLFIGSL